MDNDFINNQMRSHQTEIDDLREQIAFTESKHAKNAMLSRVSFLEDNKYRYELQLKANLRVQNET